MLQDIYKKLRSNLSASSVRTYSSLVRNLSEKLGFEINDHKDIEKHISKIVEHLRSLNDKQRKTLCSALVVLCDTDKGKPSEACQTLRDMMMKSIKKSEEDDDKLLMTTKEKQNWISYNDLMKRYNEIENIIKPLLKLEKLNKHQFNQMQTYVILSFLYGSGLPPRRSQDLTELKTKDYDTEKDNYIDLKKGIVHYNIFKTAKNYKGGQTIPLPTKMKKILKDWLRYNDNEYLFVDSRKNKLNQTKLTMLLNNFFDKKVSTNMIRHSYLTHVYENIPKDLPEMMAHSQNMSLKYRRVDAPKN